MDIYRNECVICNINKPDLLFCSHIVPWKEDTENRLNPSNTICLCALHDRLFDRGYFSLNEEYKIIFGIKADAAIIELFTGLSFKMPKRYPPDIDLLKYHFEEICNG